MSFSRCISLPAALAVALFFPACKRGGQEPALRRLAVLPIEDQSPSASYAWLARLIPFSVVRQLEGSPRLSATEVRSAADLAAPTHELTGFFTQHGSTIQAHLFLYELPSRKLLRHEVLSQPHSGWQQLLSAAARFTASALQSSAPLRPIAVTKESAARLLGQALSANNPEQAQADFRAAAEEDPACGWCWLGWAETAARRGAREEALAAITAASQHATSADPVLRARLDFLSASLRSDTRTAVASLETIAAALPGDASAQIRLAETLVQLRQFDKAVAAFQRAISAEPQAAVFWNSLAYAHAYAGRFDEALKAVSRYAELDSSPNPADSRGEILFMAGRFPEAVQAFEESLHKDPSFNQGAALEKIALCWLLQGDSNRAAQAIARLLKYRTDSGDRTVDLLRARWEFLTGQPALARQRLTRIASQPDHPLRALASAMLAYRLAFSDPSGAAALLRSTPPSNEGRSNLYRAYAAAAADPAFPAQVRDERLREELLALSLTARRDWSRAAQAWRALLERVPGPTDAPYRELHAFCLVQAGNLEQAPTALGRSWPLLAQGQMELYDFLVYPNLLFTRAEIARASGRAEEARRLYDLFLQWAGSREDLAPQAVRARAAARL